MMVLQKKKPLPGQPRKVEPLTRKAEPAAPPQLQLEVLHERMDHLATREQLAATNVQVAALGERVDALGERVDALGERVDTLGERVDALGERVDATRVEMHELHGKAMERINQVATTVDVLQERTKQMATKAEMRELHGEAMASIKENRAEMYKLHGEAMERIGKMEGDLKFIKWIGSTLWVAIIAGLVKIIFFPVV